MEAGDREIWLERKREKGGKHNEPTNDCFAWRRRRGGWDEGGGKNGASTLANNKSRKKCTCASLPRVVLRRGR